MFQHLKNLTERLRRDIKVKMYYQAEPTPAFSEKPAFKVQSNWTSIPDTQLELYLSKTEDILLSINESSKSYTNLTKDERESPHSFMYND